MGQDAAHDASVAARAVASRGDLGLAAVLEHRQKSKIRGRGRP